MNPHIKWNTFSIRLASPRSLTARDFLSVCPAENLCKNDRFFCCCFVVDQTHSECQETHWKRERENTHKCENSNNKTSQIDICANRSQINYYYVIFNDLLSLNQINEWEWSDFGWSVFDCIIIYIWMYIFACVCDSWHRTNVCILYSGENTGIVLHSLCCDVACVKCVLVMLNVISEVDSVSSFTHFHW